MLQHQSKYSIRAVKDYFNCNRKPSMLRCLSVMPSPDCFHCSSSGVQLPSEKKKKMLVCSASSLLFTGAWLRLNGSLKGTSLGFEVRTIDKLICYPPSPSFFSLSLHKHTQTHASRMHLVPQKEEKKEREKKVFI